MKVKMKVLVINWRDIKNPEAGGAETHIDEILKRKPDDWEVDFISASFNGAPKEEFINNYRVIRLPNNYLFNFSFAVWFIFFRRKKYDLIIDDISKIPLATPWYIKKTPLMAIQHHIHGRSLFTELKPPLSWYVYYMERYLLRSYKKCKLVAVSKSTFEELRSLYNYQDMCISHNGIEFEKLRKYYNPQKTLQPIALYIGRLKRYKRVDHLIKAFSLLLSEHRDAELWIAGKGDDRARLESVVAELKLENNVKFLGFVPEEEKGVLLSKVSLHVIASEKEGWGITVLEANAAGLPTVGYLINGLEDSVKNYHTGILVENGNIQKLKDAIAELFNDKVLYSKMSVEAFDWASKFTWDKMAGQFFNIAKDVINRNK